MPIIASNQSIRKGLKGKASQNKQKQSTKRANIKEIRISSIDQIRKSFTNRKNKMATTLLGASISPKGQDGLLRSPESSRESSINETKRPETMEPVIMYSLEDCPYCDKARKLLNNFKIPHTDLMTKSDDVETKAKYKELTEMETFPMIYIRNCDEPAKYAQIGGFTDLVRYIMSLQELHESDIDIVALKSLHDLLSQSKGKSSSSASSAASASSTSAGSSDMPIADGGQSSKKSSTGRSQSPPSGSSLESEGPKRGRPKKNKA